MTLQLVNEHNIDVPEDMEVATGMHDCILYKNCEIATFETPENEVEPEIYVGPFYVSDGRDDMIAKTLDEARAFIDGLGYF